jgi:hypothetical protein
MLTVLEQDFARLPELLGRQPAAVPAPAALDAPAEDEPAELVAAEPAGVQLGLF